MRLALMILFAIASPLAAQTPEQSKTRMRLQLELELQKQKTVAAKPASKSATFTDYTAARAEALKLGKPLFVAVGVECTGLCPLLRPDFVTCHVQTLDSLPAGTCLLGMPARDGGLVKAAQWAALPNDLMVRREAAQFLARVRGPLPQPVPCLTWADGT